jgi:hypothetical protein
MAAVKKSASGEPHPPYFLEAHYYSGGLRYYSFATGGKRPEWAPVPDSVGFRDEFILERDDAAIEFQRRIVGGKRVTWLGLYYHSIDEKLGDRQNHAGIGVWTNELVIVDSRKLLNALMQFAGKIAEGNNPETLENRAEGFLSDRYLPKYLAPISGFPSELSGCPFSRSELATLTLFEAISPSQEMSWDVAADAIIGMGLSREGKYTHSRALIRLPANGKASTEQGLFQSLTEDTDVFSDFVSEIPGVLDALSSRASSLERKAEQLSADLKTSQERAFTLESERSQLEARLAAKEGESATLIAPQKRTEPFPLDIRRNIEDIRSKTYDIANKIERIQTTILNNASTDRGTRENYMHHQYVSPKQPKTLAQYRDQSRPSFDMSFIEWAMIFVIVILAAVVIFYASM